MPPKKAPPFDERMSRLQEIVTLLEGDELPLEQSMRLYREGLELARSCRVQLEQARMDVRMLTEQGLQPLDAEALKEDDPSSLDEEPIRTAKETSR